MRNVKQRRLNAELMLRAFLSNVRIVRYLAQHHTKILAKLQKTVDLQKASRHEDQVSISRGPQAGPRSTRLIWRELECATRALQKGATLCNAAAS